MIDKDGWPKVAISILNWNGWQDTLDCLESVRRLDYPNYLTAVVDDSSWNDLADRIKAWAEENLGTAHVLAQYSRRPSSKEEMSKPKQRLTERLPRPAWS